MASLAASAVTVLETWVEGGRNSKRYVAKRVSMVLTGQGGTTNKIPASALGLAKVFTCGNAVKDDNSAVLPAAVAVDLSYILLGGGAANVVADYTGTYYLTVRGYRSQT